jgi:hypothetical protein
MIYIRERDDVLKDCGAQLRDLIVRTLCAAPSTLRYKEFFSFFREIFYYHQDMDVVDYDLACDTLHIFNQVLKTSSLSQVSEKIVVRGSSIDHVNIQDYFGFSDVTPGVVLNEQFKVPQESFSLALLFKINRA